MRNFNNLSNLAKEIGSNVDTNSITDLLMDDIQLDQNEQDDLEDKLNGNEFEENALRFGIDISSQINSLTRYEKKKSTILLNAYLEQLQMDSMIDNRKFIEKVGENMRRKLSDVIAVLSFLGIVRKESNICYFCLKEAVNPPIQLRNLENEIQDLENRIQTLKVSLNQ